MRRFLDFLIGNIEMDFNQGMERGDYTYMILFGQNMAPHHSEIFLLVPG